MLVPLAAEWRAGSVFGRRLERRQNHSTIGVSRRYHERRTLPLGVDQEAASGVTVHRQERAVRGSQNRIRGAGDPERGEGLGDSVWAELTSGCLGNKVRGQSQRAGQSEACPHAEPVNTGGFQVGQVRHEEGRHEREPLRLNDETDVEIGIEQLMNIMANEFMRTETKVLRCQSART